MITGPTCSLGVIAYEALTGQAPFAGDTPVSVMYKHANQKAPDVRLIRDDTHPAIAHLIAMLLEKSPSERPATALAVLTTWIQSTGPCLRFHL